MTDKQEQLIIMVSKKFQEKTRAIKGLVVYKSRDVIALRPSKMVITNQKVNIYY